MKDELYVVREERLSIPLRMKPGYFFDQIRTAVYTFNSFEDETYFFPCLVCTSIICFQFL